MPSEIGIDREYRKKQKALQKKVKGLGTSNPVVKQAVKQLDPKKDAYEDFAIVHELVSAAYSKYSEGAGSLKECMANLGKAIVKAAEKA